MSVECVADCSCSLFLFGPRYLVPFVFRSGSYSEEISSRLRLRRVPRAATYVGRLSEESRWSVPCIAQVLTRVRCFQRASSTSWMVMSLILAQRERAAPDSTCAWTPQTSHTTLGISRLGTLWAKWFFDSRQELTWAPESLIIPLKWSLFVFEYSGTTIDH